MRFARLLFPLQIIAELVVLQVVWLLVVFSLGYSYNGVDVLLGIFSWGVSVYLMGKYQLRRFSRIPKTIQKSARLGFVFMGTNFLMQEAFIVHPLPLHFFLVFHVLFFVGIVLFRVTFIKVMKRYRSLGRNYRNVVILGDTPDTKRLAKTFQESSDLGYRLKHTISFKEFDFDRLTQIIEEDEVNEIYISAHKFTNKEFNKIIDYADNNLIKIRVVPNFSGFFASNLKLDYVGFQPILVHREIALDDIVNASIKRGFDIVFSLLVIVGLLSWLVPLMALIIKWESKGPIFFIQKRSGINNEDFGCIKFRSMAVNAQSDAMQATKGDMRVTRVGAFIRKTSIDELPQFINVLLGDMSVVGPRPHMVRHTKEFSDVVDRYMLRHFVKPGITGLAQTMGYRGETKSKGDIKGRITLDRFYIENWNFFLDLKIIYKTVVNGVRGEENAY